MERFNIELKKRDCSGIYAVTQRLMTYNSNKIAGSTLTEEQIAFLFDTGSLPPSDYDYRSEDIEEAHGHYLMFNLMMRTLSQELSEELIKKFHWELKSGVYNERINGRVGRLILFRECLGNGITLFLVEAENKGNYIKSLELAQKGDLDPLEKLFREEQEVYQKEVDYFI